MINDWLTILKCIKSWNPIYEENERCHFLYVFTCEQWNGSIILIIMSDTGTHTDCTIFVTDNGDISNFHKDFNLGDVLVSSEDTVGKI